MNDSELRREKSINILKEKNIPYIEHLPVIDDGTESVVYRAVALCILALKGEGVEQKDIQDLIEKYDVEHVFTENEELFVKEEEPDVSIRNQFTWRYEAYTTLLWALGYIEKLGYPDHMCDPSVVVPLLLNKSFDEFYDGAKLRNRNEILDEADLVYRYRWAVVNESLKGLSPPGDLNPGVLYERHYALNWLIGRDDWDDVSVDT